MWFSNRINLAEMEGNGANLMRISKNGWVNATFVLCNWHLSRHIDISASSTLVRLTNLFVKNVNYSLGQVRYIFIFVTRVESESERHTSDIK